MSLLQAILDGLLIGGVYAVISIGLTLVYGVMGIVNFAQAEFLTIGMFTAWFAWAFLGLDPVLAAPLSFAVAFAMSCGKPCVEGAYECLGNDLYVCSGGVWTGSLQCAATDTCSASAADCLCPSGAYACGNEADVLYCTSAGHWVLDSRCDPGSVCTGASELAAG